MWRPWMRLPRTDVARAMKSHGALKSIRSIPSHELAKRLVYKLVRWHRFSKYLSLMADVCDCRVSLKRAARFSHAVFSNHLSSSDEVEVHSGHWWKSRSTPVHHSPDWLAGCIIYACIWCYSETQSGYVATLCTRCRLRFASICLSKWYPERPHSIDFKCS